MKDESDKAIPPRSQAPTKIGRFDIQKVSETANFRRSGRTLVHEYSAWERKVFEAPASPSADETNKTKGTLIRPAATFSRRAKDY
ncbi:MAG: hypothetical protein WEB58_06305 [Planctomycetaceae bacterium]